MSLRFEWDEEKSHANRKKHFVTFEEAVTVFADPLSITIEDRVHSIYENRYIDIATSQRERELVVAYTERHGKIRIISSRVATKHERICYEEKQP
ncbi:MAG: BrnT family toxin [Candidatus Hydrogenedentes bacterium]|nr:BrnT family toxin [Candidatus Hydrogenedentota bacterium]